MFETHKRAEDFHLKFQGFTVTSMLRGKKVMKVNGNDPFVYLPGQTVLAPPNTLLRIDFPEAEEKNPTQCTALVIDEGYLKDKINILNEQLNEGGNQELKIDLQELLLKNNRKLASITSKLIEVFTTDDPFKEYEVDTALRELVLVTIKMQNLNGLKRDAEVKSNKTAFHAVINYIQCHLTDDISIEDLCRVAYMSKSSFYRSFVEAYGITPLQLITEERLKYAKDILRENAELSIKEIAYASGFNDANYFSRIFKKVEGITPKAFRNPLIH